ncbi:hypothetical protein LOTGIDRAFT_153045 [Lottia gigantea]|uniref:ubiquitinyl hydrolase 1 n=1 Tax=Lottia gigantea TaxID=225164 RepID=V4C897_LOTGI|nr:hypothetical protein LOTGIDRAFT_153045 [Lottia gigantea]ESO97934.1 hypothetical protein LOTGIDRAFT_153045 [Lottia gigantea]
MVFQLPVAVSLLAWKAIYFLNEKTLPQDNQKMRSCLGGNLYAYELPAPPEIQSITEEEERNGGQMKESIGLSEIQRGITAKRLTTANGSVPNGQVPNIEAATTNGSTSNLLGSPCHSRSPSNVSNIVDSMSKSTELFDGFVIGVHRKMILMDVYFLSSQKTRPSLFGTPIIIPCREKTANQDLYHFVWAQVARLVSPLPPSEQKTANHAQDCDDSLGYEFPFTLKVVQKDGFTCAKCPWYRFCRGCKLECNSNLFNNAGSFVAIDWEPTALHLRYQTTQERFYEEHESVEESRRKQTEPIDLDTCLQAFTKEEELGEDELYYCSKCKKHCLACKKLDIWRLPPVLIINLKRFQFLNGRWVKSHKIVKFPFKDFDPTHYLAQRPSQTDVKNPRSQSNTSLHSTPANGIVDRNSNTNKSGLHHNILMNNSFGEMNEVNLDEDEDYKDARYDLYALSCHTGILGGGHYVAYAKNPNKNWYCYNDSSCKEIQESQVDTNSAYILFYERHNLDYNKFMPDVTGKEPDISEIDDEFESDLKKICVVQ